MPSRLLLLLGLLISAGNIQAIRSHAKQVSGVSRVVIALKPNSGSVAEKCVAGSNAPATVRFMLAYVLHKPEACKQATTLHNQIVDTTGLDVRHGTDCDVVADDSKVSVSMDKWQFRSTHQTPLHNSAVAQWHFYHPGQHHLSS